MFTLSKVSLDRLKGVHPKLIEIAQSALQISTYDFGIAWMGGLRTEEDQRKLMKTGASRTMKSKHMKQSDGYGHAFDVLPYLNNTPTVNASSDIYSSIVVSVAKCAQALNVKIKWGGCWACINTCRNVQDVKTLMESYNTLCMKNGKKPFVDMPHFELMP